MLEIVLLIVFTPIAFCIVMNVLSAIGESFSSGSSDKSLYVPPPPKPLPPWSYKDAIIIGFIVIVVAGGTALAFGY